MRIKLLLPRKLYFRDWAIGTGWVGFIYEHGRIILVTSGYNFWQTVDFLQRYDTND